MKKKSVFNGLLARYYLKKMCLMMRLVLFLLFFSVFVTHANTVSSQSSKLNLTFKNASYSEIFEKIEDQLNIGFLLPSSLLKDQRNINLTVKNENVEEVLKKILVPNGYNFEFVGKNIVVTEQDSKMLLNQQKAITGKVTDSSGATLPGVTVLLKGTANGTITDLDGNFTISNIPNGGILVFSFVGMKSQEITAAGRTSINVTMTEEAVGLGEVVAIGYGTQKKVTLTGSVVAEKGAEMLKAHTPNVVNSVIGKLPGVIINNRSGEPGRANPVGTIRPFISAEEVQPDLPHPWWSLTGWSGTVWDRSIRMTLKPSPCLKTRLLLSMGRVRRTGLSW